MTEWTLFWTVVNPHAEGYDEESRYSPCYDYNSGTSFWIRIYLYSCQQDTLYSRCLFLCKSHIYGLWGCLWRLLQREAIGEHETDQILMIRPSTTEFGFWRVGEFLQNIHLPTIHAICQEGHVSMVQSIRDSVRPG